MTLQRHGVSKHLSDGNGVCGPGIEGADAHRVTAGRGVRSHQGSLRLINEVPVRPSGADSPDVRDKQTTHQPRDRGAAHQDIQPAENHEPGDEPGHLEQMEPSRNRVTGNPMTQRGY